MTVKMLFLFISGCLLVVSVAQTSTDTDESVTVLPSENYCGNYSLGDTEGYWKTPEYPNPYPNISFSCSVVSEEGFNIEITVEDLNLNGHTKDYVLIKPGNSLESDDKGIILAWNVKDKKYLIPGKSVFMTFVTFNAEENQNYTGFSIKWKKYGEILTSTVPTSTTIDYPTPYPNETSTHTGFLSVFPKVFAENVGKFKIVLANLAQNYCINNKMNLAQKVTVDNIQIKLAIQCLYLWPDSENCIEVHFAIPVFLVNVTEYQLQEKHLKNIWASLKNSDMELLGWSKYSTPDDNLSLTLWLIISALVIALFIGFLLYIRHVGPICNNPKKKRKPSDVDDLVISPSTRQSDVSLWPTSNQVIPPIFEDNETSFPYYSSEIDNTVPSQRSYNAAYNNPTFEEDCSDEEILNVTNMPRNNVRFALTFQDYVKKTSESSL